MKATLIGAVLFTIAGSNVVFAADDTTTTTQQSADAAKRQRETGSMNENKQGMKAVDKELSDQQGMKPPQEPKPEKSTKSPK